MLNPRSWLHFHVCQMNADGNGNSFVATWILERIGFRQSLRNLQLMRCEQCWQDRVGSSGLVNRDFRLKRGLFAWCYFCFHGIVSYWWLRAAAWLQCRGKYPEYSFAMRDAMTFNGPNSYRREPLSTVEKAAFEGDLPHLRIRWAVVGVLSTLLWGGLWLIMASPMVAMWDLHTRCGSW
ncbi:protein of unknown function [Cupriavidus taiwanensis]|nr:protein of unknown function [Cupriavidus taiwanensis]